MNNWKTVKLGDVCEINPKLDLAKINDDTEVSFVPMKAVEELSGKIDLSDERKFGKVKKGYTYFGEGDVIFAKITPCMENGKIAITTRLKNGIGFGSTEFHVLKPNNRLLNKFLFNYLIQSSYRKLAQRNMTGTAGQLRVPKRFIENSEIPLPPLSEQKKIVEKIEELFSGLDSGVGSLKKAKEQIRLYRQSVLASAFSGRLINNEQLIIKNEKEKNNSSLPPGWKWVKLGDVSEKIQYGYTESASYKPIGPKFLRITDIQNGNVNWKEVPYCEISEEQKSKYLLNEGDIVFARTGATVGKSFLIAGEIPESIFASYLIRIQLADYVNKKFVYFFFQSINYWQQITEGQVGIGQPNVNGTKLSKLIIPICPIEQQHQIVSEIEKRFSEADNLEKAIDESLAKSEMLRQSILKQAFEGRLI
ncbi:MAG: restriction endonuclease subunit S [Ignavibacteriaceae bacterium]|jgi:type I restriction enzyme S subunit|nr:restriction endonuclease subunit S [Ignavibacteriaceae bacterium]